MTSNSTVFNVRDDLYGQKPRLLCWGRNRGRVGRITRIAQPLEDQVRVHRITPRHLCHRNTRRSSLEADRTLLLIRPKPLRPTRHVITIVSTINGGHYPALSARGSAVTPDVCGRPLGCKRKLGHGRACDQVRSCVRPRRCGLSCAAGLYGDMQIRTSSLTRARWRSVRNAGSPDPVS